VLFNVQPMPDGSVMHRLVAGTSVIKVRQHADPPAAQALPGGSDAATGLVRETEQSRARDRQSMVQ